MAGANGLNVVSPKLIATLWIGLTVIWCCVRFLFGSLLGVLALSLLLLWWQIKFGSSEPFSAEQVILWFSELPTDAKGAIASAVITVSGFLIAFHFATENWKAEVRAGLQLAAADEFEAAYSEVSELVTDVQIYFDQVLRAADEVRARGATDKARFLVGYAVENYAKFVETRNRLTRRQVELIRIKGKHSTLWMSHWWLLEQVTGAEQALSKLVDRIWVRIPVLDAADPHLLERYVAGVDREQVLAYMTTYEVCYQRMNAFTGMVRGRLLAPVLQFTFRSLLNFVKLRSDLAGIFHMFRGR
jgi:hypothetical protein